MPIARLFHKRNAAPPQGQSASAEAIAQALATFQALSAEPGRAPEAPLPFAWNHDYVRRYPLKTAGISAFLAGRYIFAAFFLYGFYHKLTRKWIGSDVLQQHFRTRLAEIDPQSFSAAYLHHFAIPWYRPIAWVLVLGQLSISLSMLLGLAVRPNGLLALFILLNIAAGSYVNPSLPPFIIYALLLMYLPSGHWLGLDAWLHRRYPTAIWFR